MRISYAQPTKGEVYLARKSVVRRVAQATFPDLEQLKFQTVHGVRRSEDLPYVANIFWGWSVRILSIRQEFFSADLATQFETVALSYIFRMARLHQECGYRWPVVIVGINEHLYPVPCSAGFQFPNHDEVMAAVKKRDPICAYKPDA